MYTVECNVEEKNKCRGVYCEGKQGPLPRFFKPMRIFAVCINDSKGMYSLESSPSSSEGKECACNAVDKGSTPGSGRSPGEGIGNTLKYSHLQNPMDRGAWRALVHGVTKRDIWLCDKHFSFIHQKTHWRKELSLETSVQECLTQGCGENEDGGDRLEEINMQEIKSVGLDKMRGKENAGVWMIPDL